ncbi:MAG: zf-HC2 domain-containing protein [Gemmatimonadales bacterium]|jgi:anti-sigma factor RsiW
MVDGTQTAHPEGLELSRFADADLPARRREEIARHLETCGACRAVVEQYRDIRVRVRELSEPEPPDVASEVLRRRAEGERVDLDVEGLVYG